MTHPAYTRGKSREKEPRRAMTHYRVSVLASPPIKGYLDPCFLVINRTRTWFSGALQAVGLRRAMASAQYQRPTNDETHGCNDRSWILAGAPSRGASAGDSHIALTLWRSSFLTIFFCEFIVGRFYFRPRNISCYEFNFQIIKIMTNESKGTCSKLVPTAQWSLGLFSVEKTYLCSTALQYCRLKGRFRSRNATKG